MRLVLLSPTLGLFFSAAQSILVPSFSHAFFKRLFSLFPCSFDARSLVVVLMEKKLNEVAAVERASSKKCVLFSAINVHVVSPCQL